MTKKIPRSKSKIPAKRQTSNLKNRRHTPPLPPIRSRISKQTALKLLRGLRTIRQFEERIIPIYPTDVLVTPVHLHIGQEAVPVGVCAHLKPDDTLFFSHRTHGPALAKGMSLKKLMAELFGRTTGCAGSYGGSMHLVDPPNGMPGSSSIVGGGIALGVGSALAAKLGGEDRISVSYFGDGAVDSGVFWESINFAALKSVPVLFVCENNSLSNTMKREEHLFVDVAEVPEKFMATFKADGTDVVSVYLIAAEAIDFVRQNGKPAFLECKTKRWMKHQGVERDDLSWNLVDPERDCPILKLERLMKEEGWITDRGISKLREDIEAQIDEAVEFATHSPFPTEEKLVREV
jgi:pyruvate dehydrogenase E1 component alpha subunit